jgi:hypothetical protein
VDHSLGFELGKCFLVLIPAPINVAVLVDGSWRSEKLVQALGQQRVFAAVLVGDPMTWRAWRWCPSRARLAPASVFTGGHESSCWQLLTAR